MLLYYIVFVWFNYLFNFVNGYLVGCDSEYVIDGRKEEEVGNCFYLFYMSIFEKFRDKMFRVNVSVIFFKVIFIGNKFVVELMMIN